MHKAIALTLTLLLALGLLAGCAGGSGPSSPQTPGGPQQQQVSAAPAGASAQSPGRQAADAGEPPYVVQSIPLDVGRFEVYDFGELKLHAYQTNDPIANQSYLLETTQELLAVELAPFHANINELRQYLSSLGKPLTAVIVAYHPAGADQFADAPLYASEGLGEQALVAGFVEAFGDQFNGTLPTTFELIEAGTVTISGVELRVIETDDAFDLEIPAINSYFTHMVGSGTHNILTGAAQIDAMIAQMKDFQAKGYHLILTGHDVPRTVEVAAEKIEYLEQARALLESSEHAAQFIAAMREAFPGYAGENYLEMSADALFA